MPLAGLDKRIDVWFAEDAKYFYIHMPYCNNALEFLKCPSMVGVWREWNPDIKARKFRAEDYDEIIELLHDYFPNNDKETAAEVF